MFTLQNCAIIISGRSFDVDKLSSVHCDVDITAIKSDVEQLSDLRRDMQTSLDNQQQLMQLLRENQTATGCLGELLLESNTLLVVRKMQSNS